MQHVYRLLIAALLTLATAACAIGTAVEEEETQPLNPTLIQLTNVFAANQLAIIDDQLFVLTSGDNWSATPVDPALLVFSKELEELERLPLAAGSNPYYFLQHQDNFYFSEWLFDSAAIYDRQNWQRSALVGPSPILPAPLTEATKPQGISVIDDKLLVAFSNYDFFRIPDNPHGVLAHASLDGNTIDWTELPIKNPRQIKVTLPNLLAIVGGSDAGQLLFYSLASGVPTELTDKRKALGIFPWQMSFNAQSGKLYICDAFQATGFAVAHDDQGPTDDAAVALPLGDSGWCSTAGSSPAAGYFFNGMTGEFYAHTDDQHCRVDLSQVYSDFGWRAEWFLSDIQYDAQIQGLWLLIDGPSAALAFLPLTEDLLPVDCGS